MNSNHSIKYRNHIIIPKLDFGRDSKETGWVVTDGMCNVAPGATWFHTVDDAEHAIDVLIAIGGEKNSGIFWEVMQPCYWHVGQPQMGSSGIWGRFIYKTTDGVISSLTVKPLKVDAKIIANLAAMGIVLRNVVPA